MAELSEPFLNDLENKIANVNRLESKYSDLSDLSYTTLFHAISGLQASICRIAGEKSTYSSQVQDILTTKFHHGAKLHMILGVAQGVLDDGRNGVLVSLEELIHADIFASFLEMADHLLSMGYKDAAAVLAGSSLEEHIRRLATKTGLKVLDASGRPKKADLINAELAGGGAYSKLDQKNVTAWLDLRNKAAHGHYDEYVSAQVGLLISSVRDFITRHSA